MLGDFADVLAKRSVEEERETLRTRQAWQQSATSLALALMSGAGISACRCPPQASKCSCKLMFTRPVVLSSKILQSSGALLQSLSRALQ